VRPVEAGSALRFWRIRSIAIGCCCPMQLHFASYVFGDVAALTVISHLTQEF
jgi:hypothetical protein